MRIQLIVSIVSLSILFCLQSCKKDRLSNTEITSIVNAYTQGMVYDDDIIEFRFNKQLNIDSSKLQKSISISPSFRFKTDFDNVTKILQIKPLDKLKRGQEYEIIIDVERFIPNAQKILVSQIKVYDQTIKIIEKGNIINEEGDSYMQLKLQLALKEDVSGIKGIFDYPEEKIELEEVSNTEYNIKLAFPSEESIQKINWNGSSISSDQKGVLEWSYFPKTFEVGSTFYDKTANQYKVYFSKLLDQNQDLKGLIQIGNQDASYKIENNILIVFINKRSIENISLKLSKGILSKYGDKLDYDLNYEIESQIVKPAIEWIASGSYIPSSGAFKIPFKAKGLHSIFATVVGIPSENANHYTAWNDLNYMDEMELIRYGKIILQKDFKLGDEHTHFEQWNEFGLDMTSAFEREKGMIYYLRFDIFPRHTILQCNDESLSDLNIETISQDWFNSRYRRYRYRNYYNYEDARNPCKASFYLDQYGVSKTFHCTNVFPIIKKAGSDLLVAVKSLEQNQLANNSKVDLINLQGMTIASKTIAQSGIAQFENLDSDTKSVRIEFDGDHSYFPIQDGSENPVTEFDVSSNVSDVDHKIFVYTERDVWRPSDTIYMDVMLNRGKFTFPEGAPIVVKLKNPKSVLYKKYVQQIDRNNSIYSFKMPTHLEAKTGYWKAEISIGPIRKNKMLRVETIKPNVVELEYQFDHQTDNWVNSDRLKAKASVNYLTGFPMRSGKVTSDVNVYYVNDPFEDWKTYRFIPYSSPKAEKDYELWNASTDDSGNANVSSSLDFKKFKTVTKVVIDNKIDLPGGGFNSTTESILVSPFSSYVGIEKSSGKGWKGSFQYGETPQFQLINLDQNGKLLDNNGEYTIEVLKYERDWWYDRYRLNRNYRSHSTNNYKVIKEQSLKFENGKANYIHDDLKYKSGMYLLRVKDNNSQHITEYRFHYVNAKNYSVQTNPEFIDLQLDKDHYAIGEAMDIELPTIPNTHALVNVESGEKILQSFWVNLENPRVELIIKKEWFPNFYLDISIVQNYGQENNDRPMRMYTIKKILVDGENLELNPQIEAPDKTDPNRNLKITVSEAEGRAMEYTLALVDQGLLNLTGFNTPKPLKHFSKLMALSVKTWDIFNQLIYHFNPSYAGIISIGGDGAIDKKMDESADFNRFEPVVFHLGSFKISENESKDHSIAIPNYLGQLRLMVVACNDTQFGHNDKNIKVVSPLMVQSQLPRSLNVTDVVNVPVTLFKDEKSIEKVDLSVSNDNNLVSFKQQNISTTLGDENQKVVLLEMNTNNKAGATQINFNAKSEVYTSSEETQLFVNYPNAYSEKETTYVVQPNEELAIPITSFGYDETKNVELSVSGLVLPNFTKHYSSLIGYPYGCLEQTTSKAFAMLNIDQLINLSPSELQKQRTYLDAAILKLNSYQRSDGRFNYWSNGYYHSWSDIYAGHFMVEANERNILLNTSKLNLWLDHASSIANNWNVNGIESNYVLKREEFFQAYRLFLLAKSGKAAKSAMNRFRKREIKDQLAEMLLAGAYHYINMDEIAQDIFNKAIMKGESDQVSGSFGSSVRNKAITIYIMGLFNNGQAFQKYYEDWVKEVNDKTWLSTQEKGFIFLACSTYFSPNGNQSDVLEFQLNSKIHNVKNKIPSNRSARFKWEWNEVGDQVNIRNMSTSELHVTKTERAISKDLYQSAGSNKLDLKVTYTDDNGSSINLNNIRQGDDITISISVSNKDIIDQENLALTFKTPSGWELLNPRLYTTNTDRNKSYIFQDFRDDKVYTFFTLNKNKTETYTFKAKAHLQGDFYLPPVVVENMYDGNVYAKEKAQRVSIN